MTVCWALFGTFKVPLKCFLSAVCRNEKNHVAFLNENYSYKWKSNIIFQLLKNLLGCKV